MILQVRPSEIYRHLTKEYISDWLVNHGYAIYDFRVIETGDLVLFYNNGELKAGFAKVQYAGYPGFVLISTRETNFDKFWE